MTFLAHALGGLDWGVDGTFEFTREHRPELADTVDLGAHPRRSPCSDVTFDAVDPSVGRLLVGHALGFHRGVARLCAEDVGIGGLECLEAGERHDCDEGEAEAGEQPQASPKMGIGGFHPQVETDGFALPAGAGDLDPNPHEEDDHADHHNRRSGHEPPRGR